MGYESAILYESYHCGHSYGVICDAKFEHLNISENPTSLMNWRKYADIGIPPVFVLARFLKYFVTGEVTGRL
jgi:hypothetical protein